MEWFNVVQDRDKCQTVMNRVLTLEVSESVGNFFTS